MTVENLTDIAWMKCILLGLVGFFWLLVGVFSLVLFFFLICSLGCRLFLYYNVILLFIRVRSLPPLSFEETERRVLLLKKWCSFKQKQDKAEKKAIQTLVESQQEALKELRLESEELYQAAIRRDEGLLPFERDGPNYTPPLPGYDPPEGKCIDITKVYTQWWRSLLFTWHELLSRLKEKRME